MNSKLWLWAITAALAGFLFGFDTVVISGADQALQEKWQTSDLFHGSVVMSMALWGTVVGALFGGIPTDRFGRKTTLIWIGALYFVSAIGSAFANDPYTFALMRFIGGLGVGASTIAGPAYISEIAPEKKRGQLVSLYQFNIVFGVLIAFISNYFLNGIGENAWRWMLGVEAIPAVIYTALALTLPRSPRWLVSKGRDEEARDVLEKIEVERDVDEAVKALRDDLDSTETGETIWTKKYRFPLMLAFLIAFFNQMSGVNAFYYYAPRVMEEAGLGAESALLSTIGIGVVNVLFTLAGVALIDRIGRKLLMYICSFGYILSLGGVSLAFALDWQGLVVPGFFVLFVAAHAIGQGTVIWVFISEIFPNHLRGAGQSFGSSVHWVLAAIVPSLVPVAFSTIGPASVYAIFCFFTCLQLLFVIFMMPETKGITLEKLGKMMTGDRKAFAQDGAAESASPS